MATRFGHIMFACASGIATIVMLNHARTGLSLVNGRGRLYDVWVWVLLLAWVLAPCAVAWTVHTLGETRASHVVSLVTAAFFLLPSAGLAGIALLNHGAFLTHADRRAIVYTPIVQWIILGIAALVHTLVRRRSKPSA
jgi:hypothetical protein